MLRFPGPAFEERESIAPGDQLNIGETGVGVRAVAELRRKSGRRRLTSPVSGAAVR